MEATFIIKEPELTIEFLIALKELFKNKSRLQITVSDLEDFGLLSKEAPDQYLKRLENCMKEMENPEKKVTINEFQLDEIMLEKLKLDVS